MSTKHSDSASPPAVSVIVPVYNRAHLIRSCVDSLLQQDFDEPYEIVVVDDGSTDNTAEVVESIGDARVRLVRQKNQGAAAARHAGVKAARAPIVVFQDSDDIALPNKLRVLVEGLRSQQGTVCAFALCRQRKGDDLSQPHYRQIDRAFRPETPDRMIVLHSALSLQIQHGAPLAEVMNLAAWRTAALSASADRDFYRAANDFDFQLRLAAQGAFVLVPEVTSHFELQPGGISDRRHGGAYCRKAYVLCAAADVLREPANRRELALAMRNLVEKVASTALVRTLRARKWSLCCRVLRITARWHRMHRLPRRLWWAIDTVRKQDAIAETPTPESPRHRTASPAVYND